jgi:hypothetical protein
LPNPPSRPVLRNAETRRDNTGRLRFTSRYPKAERFVDALANGTGKFAVRA